MANDLTPLFTSVGDSLVVVKKRVEETVNVLTKAGYEVSAANEKWISAFESSQRQSEVLAAKIKLLETAGKDAADIQNHLGTQIKRMATDFAAAGKPLDEYVKKHYDR